MLNKEKYAKEIMEIACSGSKIALKDGKVVSCNKIACRECGFITAQCDVSAAMWANSEYVEPPVDWSKVPVDTPILVKNSENEIWTKRHFAKYENNKIYAWANRATSWSTANSNDVFRWKYAKLAENKEV